MKWWAVLTMAFALTMPVAAQTSDALPVRRLEVEAGGGWLAGSGLGSVDADLRSPAAADAVTRLFTVDSRLSGAPAFHVKAGFAINPRVGVEGGLTLSHPELRASVTNDAEAAPPITITERIDQYGIDAGVIVMLHELRFGRRTLPLVSAGAGYLRQLHEGRAAVDDGRFFYAGGGVKHWFLVRDESFLSSAGLRVDARLYLTSGGISVDDDLRRNGAVSGSLFLTF